MGSSPTGRVISIKNLHFHWKFNIGNYEKLFRMRWLLFILLKNERQRKFEESENSPLLDRLLYVLISIGVRVSTII